MNDQPNQDIAVFTEALRLDGAARVAFLDQACRGNDELHQRVGALLGAFEQSGDFMSAPPAGIPGEGALAMPLAEKPGDRIGRYKLLQQIGEGGCGVVFMAEQEQPVRRRVALKIVKPGMDTKSVIARFEAERQALALMDHPNIAQVFDAGATASGRPYFVMELVRGIKITDYGDQNSLNTTGRLNLFIQVCSAIQHAHQKGIVHRDIKPSNILVTTNTDGKPLPKVIDFGIAKATTGQRLTDKTLFTAFEMLIGTPAYMSPEQAALTSVDVDTRSDIYSLGVLLYELVTGTTPFDTAELLKAGLDEVRRVIREQEPARPSTRLSTMIAADLTTVSHHRGADAPKLIRYVRGDLDWIVMKAMEKDRARRYPTANGLAVDVERFLGGEVILARPPSAIYKARKLIARNKLLFSGLAIIFLLMATSLAMTYRLLAVQRKALKTAQYQREVMELENVGTLLANQNQWDEAITNFTRSFDIRRQFLGDPPPNELILVYYLDILRKQKRSDEAGPVIDEYVTSRASSGPLLKDMAYAYSGCLAKEGRWKLAVPYAMDLVRLQPDHPENYHTLAPLLVATGDLPEYHKLCQEIVSRFGGTTNTAVADQVAKDCLVLPASGADPKVIDTLADFAVTHGKQEGAYTFFESGKALAEYREGNFSESTNWAEQAAKSSDVCPKTEALAILSMSEFKLGRTNDARAALADCDWMIEEKFPKLSSHSIGDAWRDWIIATSLRDEASNLIGGHDQTAAGSIPK